MRDLIEVLIMVCCFLIPFAVLHIWTWFWFALAMVILFGLSEAYFAFLHKDKMTLTEHFRAFKKRKPMEACIAIGCLALGWLVLLIHLLR